MPPIRHNTAQRIMEEQYDSPTHVENIAQGSKRCQLAPFERVRIVELKSVGWSYAEIHERYPYIPIGTIKTTISRSSKRGSTQETLPRSGGPQKLEENEKSLLFQAIEENPRIKYEALLALTNYRVSRQTIWRLLQTAHRRKWLVLQRPELTPEHARRRLCWANLVQHYNTYKWKQVFWSDESTVEWGKGARREYTFTRPKDQVSAQDIEEISVHKGIKQMFWAAFAGCGRRTGLIPLFGDPESPRGGINRFIILELYQRVLPTLLNGVEDAIFQQDNAPVHTAYIIRDWLADQQFQIMAWPPFSPDLNPIENLWAVLKAKIYEIHPEIRSMPDNEDTLGFLTSTAQEAWSAIDTDMLNNLAVSMPHRVQQVLDNDGWYTSY